MIAKPNLVDASCKAPGVDCSQVRDDPLWGVVAQDTHCHHNHPAQPSYCIEHAVFILYNLSLVEQKKKAHGAIQACFTKDEFLSQVFAGTFLQASTAKLDKTGSNIRIVDANQLKNLSNFIVTFLIF
jgi:hypothetical protein